MSSRSATLGQTEVGFGAEDEVIDEDEELKRALALSRQDIDVEDEEADLRRAIQLSMQGLLSHELAHPIKMAKHLTTTKQSLIRISLYFIRSSDEQQVFRV